jgi:hypothetical protein
MIVAVFDPIEDLIAIDVADHETDQGDGSATPLRVQAERHLSEAGIDIAGGPIRLLCMPRTLGYCFNPLSIFFCYGADGSLAAVICQYISSVSAAGTLGSGRTVVAAAATAPPTGWCGSTPTRG